VNGILVAFCGRSAMRRPDRSSPPRLPNEDARAATGMNIVMQRDNERRRVVVDGRRTDDGTRCALVVIHERNGTWALYPHGADQLGVRIPGKDALTLGRLIAADEP
jgi:hypothetical protein